MQFEIIAPDALLQKASGLKNDGYRLVQIGATRLPKRLELTYTFDLNGGLRHLRMELSPTAARMPSITSVYWGAFLYENELHDLFNVHVDGIAVDFHGTLYQTTIKFPFGSTKAPQANPLPPSAKPPSGDATLATTSMPRP